MSIGLKDRPDLETSPAEAAEQKGPEPKKKQKQKRGKKNRLPTKRTMNLFYKPDRTTKPATVALYVLFVLVCLLGLSKILIYDLWVETTQAQRTLAVAENERDSVLLQLRDYDEVLERYQRYAATDEERELVDRMEIMALLESAVMSRANVSSISISGGTVQLQFSGVTLAQTAQIVRLLEASPIVAGTEVHTASTTREGTAVDDDDDSSPVQTNVLIYLQKADAEAEKEGAK